MIAGLAKAVTLYLTPILALTAVVLSLLTFLAPTLILHDQVSLLQVFPSSDPSTGDQFDGPSVWVGLLGSCSRASNDAEINCTTTSFYPVYDFSVLPDNAPQILLSAPASAPAFVAVALMFSMVFFISFTIISFRHKMGEKMSAALDKPMIQRVSAWLGFIGFLIGITAFLIVRMWFGKGVEDFNNSIKIMTDQPKVKADNGNGFTMVWVAYAFYGVPVIVAMSKLHVKASK
ncbi:hypothetical protein BDZ89DRAFT_158739 [Hymenopellis radicata]|nr:hypothetical protein BDZ89DRAFT_158739 [Hymenopellis radicata]